MKLRNVMMLAALAIAPTACKKSPDAMADKMVSMMEDMGNAVESANGDCGKMADSLGAVLKKYDLKEMKQFEADMKKDKAKSEELKKKYGDRIGKAMPKLFGMAKCADDPKMKDLQKQLDGMM